MTVATQIASGKISKQAVGLLAPTVPAFKEKLSDFQNTVAGQTAFANLPTGGTTYRKLYLVYKESGVLQPEADMKAGLGNLKIKVNGKIFWEVSVSKLIEINKFHNIHRKGGSGIDAGIIEIDFTNEASKSQTEEDFGHLGTLDVQSLTVEVEIDDTAVSPTLEVYADLVVGAFRMGDVRVLRTYPINADSPVKQWDSHPRNGIMLAGLHIQQGSAVVDEVRLKLGNKDVYDRPKAVAHAEAKKATKRVQSGYFHAYYNLRERYAENLILGNAPFQVELKMGTTGNVSIVSETYQSGI